MERLESEDGVLSVARTLRLLLNNYDQIRKPIHALNFFITVSRATTSTAKIELIRTQRLHRIQENLNLKNKNIQSQRRILAHLVDSLRSKLYDGF